jgi:antitoxin component YwqK of YwqJK toxin-antitoxin module
MKKILFGAFALILSSSVYGQVKVGKEFETSIEHFKEYFKKYESENYVSAKNEIIKIHPNDTAYEEALVHLSDVYFMMEEYDKAIAVAKKGTEIGHTYLSNFHLLLGNAIDESGDSLKAIESFLESAKLFPNYYRFWFKAARVSERIGNYDDAYKYYQESLKRNWFHANTHYYLGRMMARLDHTTEAALSFQTFLIFKAGTDDASVGVNQLFQAYDDGTENKYEDHGTEDMFPSIDKIITSKVAYDKAYAKTSRFKIKHVFWYQTDLVWRQIDEYDGKDNFYTENYFPFIKKLASNSTQYMNYSYLNWYNQDVKYMKKAKKGSEPFIYWFTEEATKIASKFPMYDNDGKELKGNRVYDPKGELIGMGEMKFGIANFQPTGKWEFFHKNGKVSAEGEYSQFSKKEGLWKYFADDGTPTQFITYKNGELDGKLSLFHENGVISEERTYSNGEREGASTSYYMNGVKKETYNVVNNSLDGMYTYYDKYGNKVSETNYKEGKLEGTRISYLANGKIESKANYKDDKLDGEYERYFWTGQLKEKGKYDKGVAVGNWVENYINGNLYAKYSYDEKGILTDTITYFQADGKTISQKVTANKKGNKNGVSINYDEYGKKYEVEFWKNSELTGFEYYSNGQLVSKEEIKSGLEFTQYHKNGKKASEKKYTKGSAEGTWSYYFPTGEKSSEIVYEKGNRSGISTWFHRSGEIKEKTNYIKEGANGFIKGYHDNGQLKFKGYYMNDAKAGPWVYFNQFGDTVSYKYYIDGIIVKSAIYYSETGKRDREIHFNEMMDIAGEYYDTTGHIYHRTKADKKGNDEEIIKFTNGQTKFAGTRVNGFYEGPAKWYFPDGTLRGEGTYKDGKMHGKFKWYYKSGQIKSELNYDYDDRDGKNTWYYENGKIQEEGTYIQGMLDGLYTEYHENGKKSAEIEYLLGDRHGTHTVYNNKGELMWRRHFSFGNLSGFSYQKSDGSFTETQPLLYGFGKMITKYKNGKPSREGEYKNYTLHGPYKEYWSNGQLKEESDYGNYGDLVGEFKSYHENGKVHEVKNYENGVLHGSYKTYDKNGKLESVKNYYNGSKEGIWETYVNGKLSTKVVYYDGEIIDIIK